MERILSQGDLEHEGEGVSQMELSKVVSALHEYFSNEQVRSIALTPPQQYAGVNGMDAASESSTPSAVAMHLRLALRILGTNSAQGHVFREMLLASTQGAGAGLARSASKGSNGYPMSPQSSLTPSSMRPDDSLRSLEAAMALDGNTASPNGERSTIARDLNPRLAAVAGRQATAPQGESIAAVASLAFERKAGAAGAGSTQSLARTAAQARSMRPGAVPEETADTVEGNLNASSAFNEASEDDGSPKEQQRRASAGRRQKALQTPRLSPPTKRRSLLQEGGSAVLPSGHVANPWVVSPRLSVGGASADAGRPADRCLSPVLTSGRQVSPGSPAPKLRQINGSAKKPAGGSLHLPAWAAMKEQGEKEFGVEKTPRTPHIERPQPMVWKSMPGPSESPESSPRGGHRRIRSTSRRTSSAALDDKDLAVSPIPHLASSVQARRPVAKESPRLLTRRTGLSPVPGQVGKERPGDQSPAAKTRLFVNSVRQASAANLRKEREGCQRAIWAQFAPENQELQAEGRSASAQRHASPSRGAVPGHPLNFYVIGKLLGKGAFGKVNIGVHKLTEELTAMKLCERKRVAELQAKKCLTQEVGILRRLNGHANIIHLFEVIETPLHIVLVMEYASGGDLLKYVKQRGRVDERTSQDLFKQLSDGLSFIHRNNVVHRDLKLDNLLLDYAGCLKIADFGVAVILQPGKLLSDHCGTPSYMAPEVLMEVQNYDGPPIDVWSCGVVLYATLCGRVPFKGESLAELKRSVRGRMHVPLDLGVQARSLLSQILVVEPKRRLTIQEILNHQWLAGVLNRAEQLRALPDATGSRTSLAQFPAPPNGGGNGASGDATGDSSAFNAMVAQVAAFGFPEEFIVESLRERRLNYATATYHLIQQQGMRKKLASISASTSSSMSGGTGGLDIESLGLDVEDDGTQSIADSLDMR